MKLRFGIQTKAVAGLLILLLFFAATLMSISLYQDSSAIRSELLKRGRIATENLAYNAAYATLISDTTTLADFLNGVMAEREVLYTRIVDSEGRTLVARVRSNNDLTVLPVAGDFADDSSSPSEISTDSLAVKVMDGIVHFRAPIRIDSRENAGAGAEYTLYDALGGPAPPRESGSHVVGYAQVGMMTRYIEDTISSLRFKMIWITALAIALATMLVSVGVCRSMGPIKELALATGRVAEGDYASKVSEGRNDEIGDLAVSFNKMTADLKSSREALVEKELLEGLVEELRETQEQLVQAGKLAAVGQLAAGVAHEINNPLAGIMGYGQLLAEKMRQKQSVGLTPDEMPKYLSYVESMEKQSQRCKHIVQNLLKFARVSSQEELLPVDCNAVVRETVSLLEHQLETRDITLATHLDDNLPQVLGNEGKMQQVFTNILINAMQAIKQRGTITVSTAVEENRVVTRFKDSGEGIPEENLSKIFEPFFTTKEIGEGTGLGLSVSYGLVRDMGGELSATSTVGVGTTFSVSLPVAGSDSDSPPDAKAGEQKATTTVSSANSTTEGSH